VKASRYKNKAAGGGAAGEEMVQVAQRDSGESINASPTKTREQPTRDEAALDRPKLRSGIGIRDKETECYFREALSIAG
jgi:hypothetical protein